MVQGPWCVLSDVDMIGVQINPRIICPGRLRLNKCFNYSGECLAHFERNRKRLSLCVATYVLIVASTMCNNKIIIHLWGYLLVPLACLRYWRTVAKQSSGNNVIAFAEFAPLNCSNVNTMNQRWQKNTERSR